MPRPKPLFVIGSKRSGSTLMANLLNAHPRVFVSHESDILWILYQARNGPPARYVRHPLDSELMMRSTVRGCRRILDSLGYGPDARAEELRPEDFVAVYRAVAWAL